MSKAPAKKSAAPAVKQEAQVQAPAPEPEVEEVVTEVQSEAISNGDRVTIYDELLDLVRAHNAAFATQGPKEEDKIYLQRLLASVSDVPVQNGEDPFDTLSQEAQEWFNETGAAINAGQTWEAPNGFVSKFGAKVEKVKSPAKAPKEPAAPKVKEPKAPKPEGTVAKGRRLVIANLDKTLAEINALAVAQGFIVKASTMAAIYTDTRSTIEIARKMGFWNEKPAS